MKLYEVEFAGMYPVGNCLVLAAEDIYEAITIAKETIKHTDEIDVREVNLDKSGVIVYLSGDY